MSGKSTLKSFKSILTEAKLAERSIPVCLRGDLVADHEAADAELEALLLKPAQKLSGDGRTELRERIQALEAQMKNSTFQFRLRALPKRYFRALIAAHPPRRADGEIDDRDKVLGLNGDTFFDALMKVSVVEPDMGVDVTAYFEALIKAQENGIDLPKLPDGDWPEFLDKTTDKQQSDLSDAGWFLNRGEISAPFSRAASRMNPTSEPG